VQAGMVQPLTPCLARESARTTQKGGWGGAHRREQKSKKIEGEEIIPGRKYLKFTCGRSEAEGEHGSGGQ